MKRVLFLVGFMLFASVVFSQTVPYRIVFDVTSKDTLVHKAVIRWLRETLKSDPKAELEVVFYAKSLDMITKGKSRVAADVQELSGNKNVSFRVCEIAMQNNNVEKSQLLPGVGTVPDGIYEILLKQHAGWGYIKAAL
jgi:uncharacterized protein